MATTPAVQAVPLYMSDPKAHLNRIAQALNQVIGGKINAQLTVTLRAFDVTTVINDPRIGADSVIVPAMALTQTGSFALIDGIWITDRMPALDSTPGSATINHADQPYEDQTIVFLIIG